MTEKVQQQILDFNRVFCRYDDIYRSAARSFDLPELALWILYVARHVPECTLRDVCAIVCRPKQSVHSAAKYLTEHGYICLERSDHDQRQRILRLTAQGVQLAEQTADLLIAAEAHAFLKLTDSERDVFLKLFHRLTEAVHAEFQAVAPAPADCQPDSNS